MLFEMAGLLKSAVTVRTLEGSVHGAGVGEDARVHPGTRGLLDQT